MLHGRTATRCSSPAPRRWKPMSKHGARRNGTFTIAMFAAAFATQQQRHLAMDLVSRFIPRPTREERAEALRAAIDEAHRWGLPMTGHLGSIGFREAAELGIDNVEHGLWVDTEFARDKQPDLAPAEYDATAVDLDINGEAIQSMIKTLVDHHVAVTSTIAVPSSRRSRYRDSPIWLARQMMTRSFALK